MARRSVYKYEIPADGRVEMHRGAELLYADSIREAQLERYSGTPARLRVFVWALVDIDAETVTRSVGLFMTGDSVPAGWDHVASFQTEDTDGSPFLGHVFDGGER